MVMAKFLFLIAFFVAFVVSLESPVVVTGVRAGVNPVSGWRPSRQPFNDFIRSGPAFDLYILSLRQLETQNQSSRLSYYQIAGIHGRPFIEWGGVAGQYDAGYCAHGSILFPMWHRPYLALFEQIMWENAQIVSKCYPLVQRSQYRAAALTLRIPYWDWASNATMPDAVNQQLILINTPQGRMNITNPLYRYDFHPHPSTSDFPSSDAVSKYNTSVRYPDANGNSQPWKSNAQLQANAVALQDLTYQLIAEQSDYAPFSNTAYSIGRNASYNSIENMHNAIHSLVGETGHMGIIPYSSFDPIFWLHHANVDRLVAMWQAIHPESFTTPEANYEGTYTEVPGTIETMNSPLTPFYSDSNGTFFTSSSVRYTRRFGYTYPEIIDWNVTATQLSLNVRRSLNTLYNPVSSLSQRSLATHHGPVRKPRDILIHVRGISTDSKWIRSPPPSRNESINFEYFINVRVEKTALDQSFLIHFFLGPLPRNLSLWSTAPTLIASQSILFTPSYLTKANHNSTTTYGQIPLNHVLTSSTPYSSSLHPKSLAPSHVIPILTKHLSWKIKTLNPTTNQQESINIHSHRRLRRTLKIFVVGREIIRAGAGVHLPVYGDAKIWRTATRGKVGGLGENEGM